MSTLDLIIPNALIAADFAPDLLRDLNLPHLDFLAAHAADVEDLQPHGDSSSSSTEALLTPWQAWLLRSVTTPNLAEAWAARFGLAPARRWMMQAVHFEVARDHIAVDEPAALNIKAAEAEALMQAVHATFTHFGWSVQAAGEAWPGYCGYWFLTRDDALDLSGAALECALGKSVEPYLPHESASDASAWMSASGPRPGAARSWRQLINEVQMVWFDHPVNIARESHGLPAINALWLTGNGLPMAFERPYAKVSSTLALLPAFSDAGDETKRSGPRRYLESFDALITPACTQDWSAWRNAIRALDLRASELIADLREQKLSELRLVLCGETTRRVMRVRRSDFWKFWRRGDARELLAENGE